jgi:hypothetical protein
MSRKNRTNYHHTLRAAKAEFERLIQRRAELDQRIVYLKQTIAGLMALQEGGPNAKRLLNNIVPLPPRFMRLTSAIRKALAEATSPMRPPDLKTALLQRGLNIRQYANILGTLHNTLSRLEKQGEATKVGAGWTLTEKGRLASRMDSLDFVPPIQREVDANDIAANRPKETAGSRNSERTHTSKRGGVKHSVNDQD